MKTKALPNECDIIARAQRLGYEGELALNTSGNPDEDEVEMVVELLSAGSSLNDAIEEVVRTRKYRE